MFSYLLICTWKLSGKSFPVLEENFFPYIKVVEIFFLSMLVFRQEKNIRNILFLSEAG